MSYSRLHYKGRINVANTQRAIIFCFTFSSVELRPVDMLSGDGDSDLKPMLGHS